MISLTAEQKDDIASQLNLDSIDDISIDFHPKSGPQSLKLPAPLSEISLKNLIKQISETNITVDNKSSFIGGGYYDHFVPQIVSDISESHQLACAAIDDLETSPTLLRLVYDFQTLMGGVMGLPIIQPCYNDIASALTEACLVAKRHTGRSEILIPHRISYDTITVLRTHLRVHDMAIDMFSSSIFYHFNTTRFINRLKKTHAAVVLPYPDFFGSIFDYQAIIKAAKKLGVTVILLANPIALSLLKSPGELDADMAVCDGQSLGLDLDAGSNSCGILGCSSALKSHLASPWVTSKNMSKSKSTSDASLQLTRVKQRHALPVYYNLSQILEMTVYLSYMGQIGLRRVAELCYKKSTYLKQEINKLRDFSILNQGPTFNEFLISTPMPAQELLSRLIKHDILGGIDVSRFYNGLTNGILICVTEKRSQIELDYYIKMLRKVS